MKILIVTGSRADYGLLQWPIRTLGLDDFFTVKVMKIWGYTFDQAFQALSSEFSVNRPDVMLILGDRYEIFAAATAAHLQRVPIAHIGGGDVTLGSYDDAMRDCVSRMASIHFATSDRSAYRLLKLGYSHVHLVGSPGVDYILHGWKKQEPRVAKPYVLVSYQAETIDDTVDLAAVRKAIGDRKAVWVQPNPDRGSDRIPARWEFTHDEFLDMLAGCEEFIGNSSALYYEAPFLGVKTKEIGKRQRGRVIPLGDGKASERIAKVLRG